ncbi:uncharacterized protein GGS22DRAFT_192008 [Annulohypoxylon maeteangense]|uniref:uncharacterized protein n=1 Tax=Annulohypoxylon maeteangense TaxID=1927788 RepID=UPI0020076205|nr:uncharacterized protein GGS22DRAFT_192008 [Annulohypoxylon maeteangense]KAI0881814.1 hypothetical protein GGS22DRAFT_192008 [Annulohypoxylon maeteangense]
MSSLNITWMYHLTGNTILVFTANTTVRTSMVRFGFDLSRGFYDSIEAAFFRCLWALFVWVPIFCLMRIRLYPIERRNRDDEIWDTIVHFLFACCDAFVMAVATDHFMTGKPFEIFKALLMLAWFVWMYDVIETAAPLRRRYI